MPSPQIMQLMQRAAALLQAGNVALARTTLEQVIAFEPGLVEAHRLRAGALQALGDAGAAERTLQHALSLDATWAPTLTSLAELFLQQGRQAEAEALLRRALTSPRPYARAALTLARLLNETRRFDNVLALGAASDDLDLLQQQAFALVQLERHEEAIALHRRIVARAPANANAELALAAALDDYGEHRAAATAVQRAITKGAVTAQAHALRGQALIAAGEFDAAQASLQEALRLDPADAGAHRLFAQLIWMRSGDVTAASARLDQALARDPGNDTLAQVRALLMDAAGEPQRSFESIADRVARADAGADLLLSASQALLRVDATRANAFAMRAVALRPVWQAAQRLSIETLLAVGDAGEADRRAGELLQREPNDQHLLALRTTAWRLLGDARYSQWCNYADMARAWTIATPPGWPDLAGYLRDLATCLHRLHTLHAHPLHNSLRGGSQTTQNLLRNENPVIRAFFTAIDEPIRRHIETIAPGDTPLARRKLGGYRLKGCWSVRLRGAGYHTNHVHPQGWLSSACYIQLPRAISGDNPGREGFLKFGEPGYRTTPALAPDYFIRPEPGLLALFPSYFWHGTVPFAGDDSRLTIAFDLVPA